MNKFRGASVYIFGYFFRRARGSVALWYRIRARTDEGSPQWESYVGLVYVPASLSLVNSIMHYVTAYNVTEYRRLV